MTADQGRLAIERGPIVYALEGVDNGGEGAGLTPAPGGGRRAQRGTGRAGGRAGGARPAPPAFPRARGAAAAGLQSLYESDVRKDLVL